MVEPGLYFASSVIRSLSRFQRSHFGSSLRGRDGPAGALAGRFVADGAALGAGATAPSTEAPALEGRGDAAWTVGAGTGPLPSEGGAGAAVRAACADTE